MCQDGHIFYFIQMISRALKKKFLYLNNVIKSKHSKMKQGIHNNSFNAVLQPMSQQLHILRRQYTMFLSSKIKVVLFSVHVQNIYMGGSVARKHSIRFFMFSTSRSRAARTGTSEKSTVSIINTAFLSLYSKRKM